LIALQTFWTLIASLLACLQLKKENIEQQSIKRVTLAIADFLANVPSRCDGRICHTEIFIA
jgi:hypothetical protein